MKEKTLNDEKLLNDIKNSIKISKDFRFNDTTIRIKDLEDILNLIYRLHNDISGYVSDQEIWFTRVKGLENEKAELQKQVDELKQENSRLNLQLQFQIGEVDKKELVIEHLQKKMDELKKRLHWIWAIGVDYDGCSKVESLKGLIDEMVELTQIESKDLDEYFTYNTTQGGKMNILDIVRKIERKETADKFERMLKKEVVETRSDQWGSMKFVEADKIDKICKKIKEGNV